MLLIDSCYRILVDLRPTTIIGVCIGFSTFKSPLNVVRGSRCGCTVLMHGDVM